MTRVVAHVRDLHASGALLFAWSSGGAEYARSSARELGVEECFATFLPKPNVLIDDQEPTEWRRLVVVHPGAAATMSISDYERAVAASPH